MPQPYISIPLLDHFNPPTSLQHSQQQQSTSHIIKNLLMTWFFETCTDEYGSCIRQYVMFGVSLIVLSLALFSSVSIVRRDHKIGFQLLPILINTVTSFIIFGIYTQIEVYNIRIILLIIEVYSYFILTYGFIYMVRRQKPSHKEKLRPMNRILLGISIFSLSAIIAVLLLSIYDVIQCSDDQGVGSIILVVLQIPLFFLTYFYTNKSKAIIRANSKIDVTEYTQKTYHIMDQQDQSKKIKLLQVKLVRFAFIVSFVLHAIQLFCYFIGDEQIICSDVTHRISVTNQLQLYILCMENISEMFPHFIIPFIFWYLPARMMNRSGTIYMSSEISEDFQSRPEHTSHQTKIKMNRTESKLVNDVRSQEEIRQRLNQNLSPQRHVNRIPTL